MIEAAGGVVWRRSESGEPEILLIHRPRYDDWSLPKGKLDRREAALDAALREVEEETGLRCDAHEKLPEVRYRDRKDRAKRVRYWAMRPVDGEFRPNDEVDQVRWVVLADASKELTYGHDAEVVGALADVLLAGRP